MQNTLFGEPIKKVREEPKWAKEKPKEKVSTENIIEDNTVSEIDIDEGDYHAELNAWGEKCKAANESYLYKTIEYRSQNDLKGTTEWITTHESFERIWRGASASYGGMWGGGGNYAKPELIKKLRNYLKSWYNEWITTPYNRERADDWQIRGVRKENIKIFFSTKAKEFIKRVGEWDTDELIKELEAMPEVLLTEETYKPIKDLKDAEIEGSELWDKIRELEKVLQKVLDNKIQLEVSTIAAKHKELADLRLRKDIADKRYELLRQEMFRNKTTNEWEDMRDDTPTEVVEDEPYAEVDEELMTAEEEEDE